jgi:hypothetical protein
MRRFVMGKLTAGLLSATIILMILCGGCSENNSCGPGATRCPGWSAVGTGHEDWWGSVEALEIYEGDLIAGGNFFVAPQDTIPDVARWDGTSWSALGSGPGGPIYALRVYEGDLIAGGVFYEAQGGAGNCVARWDGNAWHTLGSGVDGGSIACLSEYGGDLIAGGDFTSAGGNPAEGIARWNGTSWSSLGSGVESSSGVKSMAVYDGELYVAGVAEAGGTAVTGLARWNGTTWSSAHEGLVSDNRILELTVYDAELIASGWITGAGGKPANFIAQWDGDVWAPMGTGLPAAASAFAALNGELYTGLSAYTVGIDEGVTYVFRWDGHALWIPLIPGLGGRVVPSVRALTVYKNSLVVGGDFATAGEDTVNLVAAWHE